MSGGDHLAALRRPNRPSIEGVRLDPLTPHTDSRGWLVELVRRDNARFPGFGQLYLVTNFQPNRVRAYHKHLRQDEVFFVPSGTMQIVCVDDREDSPTRGRLDVFVLCAGRPHALSVPRGVHHGTMPLTAGAQLLALTNLPYDPAEPDEVRIPWDTYGDVWHAAGW